MSAKIPAFARRRQEAPLLLHRGRRTATSPRDGRYIEQIGTFDPMLKRDNPERVKLKSSGRKHWLSVGAQPTDRVARLLDAAGLMKRKAPNNPEKAKPKKKAQERAAAADAKAKESAAASSADAQ